MKIYENVHIINLINDYMHFSDQISFKYTCKFIYNKVRITNMMYLPATISMNITDDVLVIYKYVKSLNIDNNNNISSLNYTNNISELSVSDIDLSMDFNNFLPVHNKLTMLNISFTKMHMINLNLPNLKKLIANGDCGFTQLSVDTCYIPNIYDLDIAQNMNVIDVNKYSKTLHKLSAFGVDCNLKQSGITKLNLITHLSIHYNQHIFDINHMVNIVDLDIMSTKISNYGIRELKNVIKLNVSDVLMITDINHMTRIEILIANFDCLSDNGIKNLHNVLKLDIDNNKLIHNINHMKALFECNMRNTIIPQENITMLENITHLCASYNGEIYDLNHMKNLIMLEIIECNIHDYGIDKLENIEELDVSGCCYLKDINHMKNLKILRANDDCLSIEGIGMLNLEYMEIHDNPNFM